MLRALLMATAACAAAATLAQQPAPADERFRQLLEQARSRSAGVASPQAPISEDRLRERLELLRKGEAALAALDVDGALAAFDQASAILHAADTELGLVRSYMQGGEYRRALAFVAHTAGAHREAAGGPALYAWLLHLGGQRAAAKRLLDETAGRMPDSALIQAVGRELASPLPRSHGMLLEAPARLAPYGAPMTLPGSARVAGTGVLVDAGRRAILPAATLGNARSVWLRNGLGAVSRAQYERRLAGLDVAVLRLDVPLPAGAPQETAPRDPFPGSPGITIEYAPAPATTPGWPLLSVGFAGTPIAETPYRRLGIDLPAGPRGGPVFDAAGRLAGISLPGSSGGDRLAPVSRLRGLLAGAPAGEPAPSAGSPMPVDQIYESSLRSVVQVIVAR